jgi:hypothetical protein
MRVSLSLLLAAFIAGCSQQDLLSMIASTDDQAMARKYIDLLRDGRFDEIEQATDPSIRSQLHDALGQMADMLPEGDPTSITLVGAHKATNNGSRTTNLTFEYGFGEEWFIINVAWLSNNDAFAIIGFNVYDTPGALEELNKLELAGKSPTHYLFLALVVALPIFSIYALIVCARTRMSRRKWPWIIFILFGVGNFALNWTTGEVQFAPLQIQLLSASAAADLYGPWVLSVSLPLGALLFLLRRRSLSAPEPQA